MRKTGYGITFLFVMTTISSQLYAKDDPLEWKSADGDKSFKVGGLLRFNHRYEQWPESDKRGGGKLDFDIFRLDLKGTYGDFYFNASPILQDKEMTSIEKAYIGYKINSNQNLEAGLVYKPFAIYPYPQNGWTYHLPFFLGYGNNIAPGLNWSFNDSAWDIKLGYYPRMLDTKLRYSPESATYDELSKNHLPFQAAYQNEKRNQLNTRVVHKFKTESFGKHEVGFSGAVSQLYNTTTKKDGHYHAVSIHTDSHYQRWNLQSSIIHYEYDAKNPIGVDNDRTLMGANGLTPAYFIASEGTVYSMNLAYTLPITEMGMLKAIRFYNDYSYLDKARSGWNASQMNTTGAMFIAKPFMVWADYTWAKNANILGGAQNGTGLTSGQDAKYSNQWLYRVNLNLGFTF